MNIPAAVRRACLVGPCFWGLIVSLGIAATASAAEFRVVSDLSYLEPGRTEKLDLYLPARNPADLPNHAAVWIHGGGWTGGDKTAAREKHVCGDLAAAGLVVASVNYRLGNGAWPTNLLDCKNGVRFLRAHAAEYHLDPRKIAVLGGSAGGHLALMVGLTTGEPKLEPAAPYPGVSDSVDAIVDLYGPTDISTQRSQHALDKEIAGVFGLPKGTSATAYRAYSPVWHVTSAAPPVLILHGLIDPLVPYSQASELDRALAEKGVTHELIALAQVGHGFDLSYKDGFALTSAGQTPLPFNLRSTVIRFLRQNLDTAPRGRSGACR